MMSKKENVLFFVLGGFFITNALVAELIGSKLFSLERVFGFEPLNLTVFGEKGLSLTMSAGSILWPFVFVFTDIINEYYGRKGVRLLSLITAGLILYAFLMIYMALGAPGADVWFILNPEILPNIDVAYTKVMGMGMNMIVASVTAFLIGQLLDVWIFQKIRDYTGEKQLWLRALASTAVSQLIDSFVVVFIAFYLFGNMSLVQVFALIVVSYPFKFVIATLMTPILYLVHYAVDSYLGKERSHALTQHASHGEW